MENPESPSRTIWTDPGGAPVVHAIDQRVLPFEVEVAEIASVEAMAEAIRSMLVRGAGLIGVAGGYGMALAATEAAAAPVDRRATVLAEAAARLEATRPTAVNLAWATQRVLAVLDEIDPGDGDALERRAWAEADAIAAEDVEWCRRIGQHGLPLLAEVHERTQSTVEVLTHCNAGWLAFVEHGSATAPIYAAHEAGIPVHVWVDETRPRNQGARLTAWELAQRGVPHTVVVDNAGGHLMQHGRVDLVLTGSDRTTSTGDVANKIGTYLKALAAHDNGIPFHVALPSSSLDWTTRDGVAGTPIEERDPDEVATTVGLTDVGPTEVRLVPEATAVANHAFDVTPARLVTGLITERGRCAATEEGIAALFPERGAPPDA